MTTTTGDPSTLKTPPSLSGGDLVSRLLAATPPYLYNVPLTPHSFFFSEMLRSFVQAKAEATPVVGPTPSVPRRRKRSWRDARERPLELTTKERSHHHHRPTNHGHHHGHQPTLQQEKEYLAQHQLQQHQQQQQDHPLDTSIENMRSKSERSHVHDSYESNGKNHEHVEVLKPVDGNRSQFDHARNFFSDRIPHVAPTDGLFSAELEKLKSEESQHPERKNVSYPERIPFDDRARSSADDPPFLPEQKNKSDFSARSFLSGLPGRGDELQIAKGFGLPGAVGNAPNPDFLPGPLWYPPYPMPQSYPGIDPLHFFIDLRVSGHIWDRKLNERQLPFSKNKHSSAFSVPQSKEYNHPLNLTRDEAVASRTSEENVRGTHYILKNISRTYKDILAAEKDQKSDGCDDASNDKNEADVTTIKKEEMSSASSGPDDERKNIRALIDLELVVDYVKESKKELNIEKSLQATE